MQSIEQKGERFIIKARLRSLGDVPISKIRTQYKADIIVKHGNEYLVLEYLEPANILEYYDNEPKSDNSEEPPIDTTVQAN